jgi:hypothetical protein
MLRRIKRIRKYMSIFLGIGKNLSASICASKGKSTKTTDQG